MGVNLTGFDATQVDPMVIYDAIPADFYVITLVEATMDENGSNSKDPSGQSLHLTYQVEDGEYKGRKLWDRLSLINANQKAVEIAQRTLSAICHAAGKLQPKDTDDLLGISIVGKVEIEEGSNGKLRNVIKGYKSVSDHQKTANASPTTQAQAKTSSPAFTPKSTPKAQQQAVSKPGPNWAN
jgi:Protein of unknown function (DUF669)